MKTKHINVIHVYIEKTNISKRMHFFSLVQNRNILKFNITKKRKNNFSTKYSENWSTYLNILKINQTNWFWLNIKFNIIALMI